jgi:predicted phage tail protein
MAITRNVARGEGIFRIVLGVILILFGFFLAGFWMPLSIVIGGLLVLTGIVGY